MVSVKPTGPSPVQPVTAAPTPWPPCTRVAQIQSPCRDQSVAACQTRPASACTRTCAVTCSGLLTPTNLANRRGGHCEWQPTAAAYLANGSRYCAAAPGLLRMMSNIQR